MSVVFSERKLFTAKKPATISQQLEMLRERRMIISASDEKQAYSTLESINYYRLLHYFAVFLEDNGQYYKSGTTFKNAMRLYDFDRKLRTEILVALEEIEISIRAAVSNYHTSKYGVLGYLNEDTFDIKHNHKAFSSKIAAMLNKNSELTFVKHYTKKHGGSFPLWVMMEMFSFGMLVFFYQDMKPSDRKDIALHYFKINSRTAENWFENLAALRNHCAHYNRVYGNSLPLGRLRKVENSSVFPREYEMSANVAPTSNSSLFDCLLAIRVLHRRSNGQGEWRAAFVCNMKKLFDDYSDIVNPEVLGFPEDWVEFFVS